MPRQYRDEPDQQLPASAGNGHRPRANGDAIPPRTREGDAGEARFDRGARLALAITGAWVAGLLALTLAVLQYPSDGWSSARRGQRYVVELPLTGTPSPLRAGDVVVAIDGRPLAPRSLPPLPPRPRVGQVLRYSVQRDGRTVEADVALVRPGPVGAARGVLARLRRDPRDPVGALASFAVVAWAFARRPRNPGARYLLLAFGYYFAAQWCGSALPGLYAGTWPPAAALAAELVAASWAWFFFPSLALLALAFPVVKAPLRRLPRLLPGLLYGAPLALSAAAAWSAVAARGYALADALLLPAFLGALALAVAALLGTLAHNWRTVREPVARAQLRWVALGLGAGLGLPFTLMLLAAGFTGDFAPVAPALWLTLLVPLALAVAIARYRLWDLDLLVNRALVYGALTACVAGLYALVVGRLGALVGGRGETWPHLLAAGLVAALFGPLRARLQRGVNRLLYGDRDEPYAALARLGRQLGAPLAPDALPGAIVTTVREALRLPYAAIAPPGAGGAGAPLAAAGDPAAAAAPGLLRLPLAHGGEAVGALLLAPRAPGEGFSAADRRLLGDLARQAGVAVRAAGLHADLLRARQRLVAAREEERRRLRRDLHDGLGPQLASLAFKAEAARNLLGRDPARADALLAAVADQAQGAIADIRRLVHALRPPALDELGLAGALRQHAAGSVGLRVEVEAPAALPPLPAAVEVAAYRIALEAVTNAARHARARRSVVRLAFEGTTLQVEVADDGIGLPAARTPGVGLAAMRERAAELGGTLTVEALPGGGTRVAAALPLGDGPADARTGDETGGDPTVATASPPESAAAAGRE